MTLSDFETLVLTQQPAGKPWSPVTDYSFESRKAIEGQHPSLILDVFEPIRVLDVGCGFRTLVDLLNEEAGSIKAFGADVSNPAADHLFDITADDVPHVGGDLVICREVLEHLTVLQIRRAVVNLCALSTRFVYGTTRFSSEHDVLRVETSDNLDPTHITLMSKDLLRILFCLEGFAYRRDLTALMDWQSKGRTFVFERVHSRA